MFATQRNLSNFYTFRRDAGILGILNHRNQRLQLLRDEAFCQVVFFFLNISRLLIVKLIIPEKHIAARLQMTTSQPVNFSISRSTPNLNRNTAELERLYAP